MPRSREDLASILAIGQLISNRGEGMSIQDALLRTEYASRRPNFTAKDLVPLVRQNPSVIDQWFAYSEDKRTSGGWYLTREGQVGRVEPPVELLEFASMEEAVAEYVVRELDFWASI